uniref:Reverse transcriptase domain-containing protein n=1 Tax=Panagrellus redivivus TaxID=6233 RepID=A0A7E4ZSV4_PANRE
MSEPERSNTPPSDDEDELERKLAEKEKLLKSEKKALLQARIEATIRQTAELTQAKGSELNAAKEKEKKHEEEKIAKAGTKRKTEEETKDNPVTEARLKKLIAEAQMSGGNFSHTFANRTSRMAANFAKEIMALANNVEDGEQIMTKAKGFYYKLVLMADNPSADKMFESFEAQAELTGTPVASIIQVSELIWRCDKDMHEEVFDYRLMPHSSHSPRSKSRSLDSTSAPTRPNATATPVRATTAGSATATAISLPPARRLSEANSGAVSLISPDSMNSNEDSKVPQAGTLSSHLDYWLNNVFVFEFVLSIIKEGYRLVWRGTQRPQFRLKNARSALAQADIVTKEIQTLLKTGAAVPAAESEVECVSPLMLVPNNGKHRLVLNLSQLNEHLITHEFKLEDVDTLKGMIEVGSFGGKADMTKGYHHILMAEEDTKFLGFEWNGSLFKMRALPFGLSPHCGSASLTGLALCDQ